jgi:hypothetical protein
MTREETRLFLITFSRLASAYCLGSAVGDFLFQHPNQWLHWYSYVAMAVMFRWMASDLKRMP